MDQFRFRRLERYRRGTSIDGNMELEIPLPRSASGMVYRFCPSAECTPRHFLLGDPPENQQIPDTMTTRIRRIPGQPGVTCPYCGDDAADDEFFHPHDEKHAADFVEWAAGEDVADGMDAISRSFNRRTRDMGGLFDIRMTTDRRPRPEPFAWREDLLRSLTCDTCQRPYGVYAIALFCPDCGTSNLSVHFRRETELIQQQVELANRTEAGQEELAFRLLGNAHEDVLTALETYLKTVYRFVITRRGPEDGETHLSGIGSAFQNIDKARERFSRLDMDPYGALDSESVQRLRDNIEKRHVVGHNLSMADEKYSRGVQAEDTGKTVRLVAEEVLEFVRIASRVIEDLESSCPELQARPS